MYNFLSLTKSFLLQSLFIQLITFIPAYIFQTDKLTDLSYGMTFVILATKTYLEQPHSLSRFFPFICILAWGLRLCSYLFIRIMHMEKDKRFDGMRENFFKFFVFFLIQGITVFLIALPTLLYLSKTVIPALSLLSYLGLFIWASGLMLETIADHQKFTFLKQKTGLWIDQGLWHYSRHPNYFGEMFCWLGLYLYAFPALTAVESLITFLASPAYITGLLLFVSGIPILEKEADICWGKNPLYQQYKKQTSIFIPWFREK